MDSKNKGDKMQQKKLYTIIIVIAVIIVIGWIVKASMYSMMYSGNGYYMNRGLSGATTYSNKDTKVTVGSNVLPENWPSDAPKYPNAKIQYSGSTNPQTGEKGAVVMFMTSDSTQTVVDFYKKQLASNGWTIEQTAAMGPSTVLSAKKDTRTFGVYITDSGNGQVSVTVGIGLP